jgi:YggT family protein
LSRNYKKSNTLFQEILERKILLAKESWTFGTGSSIIVKKLLLMLLYILNAIFTTYSFMLLTRVFGSWFPNFAKTRFMQFIAFYTDPYLNIFRKLIPPLGMIDISPMFAFLSLQLIQWVLYSVI